METVKIKSGTKLHAAIKQASEKFGLNPSAFATGLLYAACEKAAALAEKAANKQD